MRLFLLIIPILFSFSISANDIEISLIETKRPIVGTRHIAIPVRYDSVENYVSYTANKGRFNIKAELKKRNLIYTISIRPDTAIQFSFRQDSILKWHINNTYDLHAIKFKHNNHFFYFIPGTKIQYNDSIYNQFPCMISEGEIKQGCFIPNESTIYVLRDTLLKDASIFVKENGHIHSSMLLNGLNYKNEYSIKDTIPINNIPYIVKSLDWDNSNLVLTPTYYRPIKKIDSTWLNNIFKGIEDKEYVFIDFWGTWCAPCIQALPAIKNLYLSNKDNIAFFSICYDSIDNYTKFQEILGNHGVEWKNDFVSFDTKSSIIEYLNIESFPSFALINKHGEVLFILSGDSSLNMVDSLLKKISSSK